MNIWIAVVLMGVLILAATAIMLAVLSIRRYREIRQLEMVSGEPVRIPLSPVQKRALLSMIISLVSLLAVFELLMTNGVTAVFNDDPLRLAFTAIVLASVFINAAIMIPLSRPLKLRKSIADERDLTILNRAPVLQGKVLLIFSALWGIGLTEYYWDQGAIPIDFAYLIFWTNILLYTLSWAMGVLLGYWRMNTYGE